MQLSMEGERLLKAHDYEGAIEFFEAGLRQGTEDKEILSAIYNQLGNACFYVGKYHKALEYHKKDLEIAEQLGDRQGMAKAYGNLGNTFKALKNYTNAIKCCENHLDITRELGDRLGEGRACYNLGNVHHAIGKAKLSKREQAEQAEGRTAVLKAIEYYRAALTITVELKDTAGEGRAVGNLGNAYTAIGEYAEAIQYHRRRLKIANDANDAAARARACGNLGNAYSALGDISEAIKFYQQSLAIAKDSNSLQSQGQAYYCLASSYNLQKNSLKAVEYFENYLQVANSLGDKSMQLRAWYNLRNCYHQLGDSAKMATYHRLIQQAQGNKGAQGAPVQSPTITIPQSGGKAAGPYIPPSAAKNDPSKTKAGPKAEKEKGLLKGLFKTGPRVELATPFSRESDDDDDEVVRTRHVGADKSGSASAPPVKAARDRTDDWLNDAITLVGKQEAAAPASHRPPVNDEDHLGSGTDFFDMLMAAQTSRLDDQRASGPAPGARGGAQALLGGGLEGVPVTGDEVPDDDFFDMLVAMQHARLDEQRSPAPRPASKNAGPQAEGSPAGARKAVVPVLDEGMSFFEMLAAAKSSGSSSS